MEIEIVWSLSHMVPMKKGTNKETQKYNEKRAVKATDRMEGQVLLRCSYLGRPSKAVALCQL